MTPTIIFHDSFLVAGIMCHRESGCGAIIQTSLTTCLDECIAENLLPQDAQISIDAEPQTLGVHRLFIKIRSETLPPNLNSDSIATRFKDSLTFDVLDNDTPDDKNRSNFINWINILINLTAICTISILSVIYPPSLLLTIGLTTLSFVVTAFTARAYLINFFLNLRNRNFTTMPTTVTLGWLLSLAHSLYHSLSMPLASSLSMTFMSFIMPIILITVINSMDEIKRLILNKSTKMHLKNLRTLFPQIANQYDCYPLSQEKLQRLERLLGEHELPSQELDESVQKLLKDEIAVPQEKSTLQQGMIILVKRGECFPVDCILIEGNTVVDASLLTGEPRQNKKCLEYIPAGAVNLDKPAYVLARASAYNSTVNKLLFRSNRARDLDTPTTPPKFTYLYSTFIFAGIVASIATPMAFGIVSTSLLLQNIIGVLFAVCPCTIAIAQELPNLLSTYHRSNKGITLRDANLIQQSHEIHTVVFDKTGTLTTGNSQVESAENISAPLWARIYLLENQHGAAHPLANAITTYYKARWPEPTLNDVEHPVVDPQNRGLSAMVQGKKIHLGNAAYLTECGITINPLSNQSINKLGQGFSPVYVAEDGAFKGVIFIKHEIRKEVLTALSLLKKTQLSKLKQADPDKYVKIIMLTGDNEHSAIGFNLQNGTIFDEGNIHANETPEGKEAFLMTLMSSEDKPKGVWFVGDGLNDAPCARIVSEKGGVSCAMTSDDKAAFFTDISLNGTLDCLFEHNNLNRFLKKIIFQNQALLIYSLSAFLAFIITFSIAGIAVSPLIPLLIMVSTTMFTLFNSYRIPLSIDNAFDKKKSWLKEFLASDASIGLLFGASFLFICGVFISTVTMGQLAFPAITFTAGTLATIGTVCMLTATAMVSLFTLLSTAYLFTKVEDTEKVANTNTPSLPTMAVNRSLPVIPANNGSRIVSDIEELNDAFLTRKV